MNILGILAAATSYRQTRFTIDKDDRVKSTKVTI